MKAALIPGLLLFILSMAEAQILRNDLKIIDESDPDARHRFMAFADQYLDPYQWEQVYQNVTGLPPLDQALISLMDLIPDSILQPLNSALSPYLIRLGHRSMMS